MMSFEDKLRNLMNENKISSAERLSKKLDGRISPNAIRNYLKGIRPKSMYYYEILADFFNVDVDFLYNESNENRKRENKSIGEQLGLSDKSISNIKKGNAFSVNFLLESDFFNINIRLIDMIKDLKEINKFLKQYSYLYCNKEQKLLNIERIQMLCNNFHSKYYDFPKSFDLFDSLGIWNMLERYKDEILRTKDSFNDIYITTINTSIHSVNKSIKIINSEMKDYFVYFIKDLNKAD